MRNQISYETFYSKNKLQERVISDNNFTYRTIISLYNKYLKNKTNIVDVGCGVGTVDFYLCSKGHKLLGIDVSQNAINIASKNSVLLHMSDQVRFIHQDFSLIKKIGSCDAIIALEVLEHVENDRKLLNNLSKLCLKGTIIIASSPSLSAPLYRIGFLRKFDRNVGHLRRYTEKGYKELFGSNGFKVVDLIKTEGILRNFLFTNKYSQSLVRLIKGPLVPLMNLVDDILLKLFGASNYYVIAIKK